MTRSHILQVILLSALLAQAPAFADWKKKSDVEDPVTQPAKAGGWSKKSGGGDASPAAEEPAPTEEAPAEGQEEGGDEAGGNEGDGDGGEGEEPAGGDDGDEGGEDGEESGEGEDEEGDGKSSWTPIVGMDGHVFPSFIIAASTKKKEETEEKAGLLGDPNGMFGASVVPASKDAEVEVTVTCDKIMDPSTFKGKLWDAGAEYTVMPKIRYKYDALMAVKQQCPVDVVIKTSLDGEVLGEEARTLTLRSINDCPFVQVKTIKKAAASESGEETGEEETEDVLVDMSYTFAAYVNENHPSIDELLKQALASKIVENFAGYQAGDPVDVLRQVYAVWAVLHGKGVKYSSVTASPGSSNVIASQHVRFMDEVDKAGQANCADGSVLIASVLRKIEIDVYLVKVPGHMYIAFGLDEKGEKTLGLETTVIGLSEPPDLEFEIFSKEVDAKYEKDLSFKTFRFAVQKGTEELKEAMEKSKEGAPGYLFMNITNARQMGVMPIARN